MIAEYLTRRDAEIYASELTKLYGPAIHFDVVGMPDPVFGDTVGQQVVDWVFNNVEAS